VSSKNILIIGAGREQIPAYITAKEMGLSIIGTDMDKNAPAFHYADEKLIASTRDPEGSLEAIKKLNKKQQIEGVFTIANDVPLTVATIAEYLNLPSISTKSAKLLSNKVLMKDSFSEAGVSSPPYSIVSNVDQIKSFSVKYGLPIILKPIDGRGSKGVMYIDNLDEVENFFGISRLYTDQDNLIVEKYIKGLQLSVESIFINNKYIPIAFADRNYENQEESKPFVFENGGVMPSRIDKGIKDKINNLVAEASSALGISWGTVKADIVMEDDEPVIIELAGRLSGGELSTFDIPHVYNVDIVKALIKLSLGEKVSLSEVSAEITKGVSSRYVFTKNSGNIIEFEFPNIQSENIYTTKLLDIGEKISSINKSAVETKAGIVRVLAENVDIAEQIAEDIVDRTTLVVS